MMANLQALESGDMYTVGWISALPLELAAATAMLDEEHAIPTGFNRSPSDQNNYTFGRMGEHNLVIASLPAGVYGTISAATTASQMLSSFPNIRIGLMVGIGAGIPRLEEYDIRLGDVVVSQPDGLCGGVVQYDLGKARADGSFQRKGMLNRPPLALLNALSSLQARHIKSASKISSYVNEMLEQYPRMKKSRPKMPGYTYQGVENDKLFEPMYLHLGGPKCTTCEPAREIPRDARDSTDPEIHYGIIASGNTLVKDAVQRDELAKGIGEECICFEMEAAGIMNTFPCVVIRGICDYADSHKNDRWQGYAAATAAAYAKELLEVIPSADIQQTEKATEVLQKVQETVDNTNKNVKELCGSASLDRLINWLHAPDPSVNYNRAIQQRHPGTGLWFLQSKAFADWNVGGNGFLWLHGLAGCGKTVLSSIVIERLQEKPPLPHTNLLYFFFDFNDKEKQSHENMIRTLIQQLYTQEEASRHLLEQFFERYDGRNEQPSLTSLEDTFASMLTKATHTRIMIDALDESCQQRDTLEWLRRISLNQSVTPNKLTVIITSRREYDIESAFLKWLPEKNVLPIRADDVNKDISDFVHSQIQLDPRLERWRDRPDVQSEIELKLIAKACGMFRWVTCQLVTLKNCLDLADLREALDDLPDGLDETYSRILARVDARNQAKAITMLQLLVWAKRELTLNELVDALAIRQGEEGLHYDPGNKMPVSNEIAKILPGLIVLDVVESWSQWSGWSLRVWIRLAHLSVKEYLTSDSVHGTFKLSLEKLNANIAITDMCIAHFYTSYPESHVLNDMETRQETDSETGALPYFVYYLRFWADHARVAQADESASERIVKVLTSGMDPGSPFVNCIRFTDGEDQEYPASPDEQISDMTALVYASGFGLDFIVSWLLETDGQGINAGRGNDALEAVVRTLLENRATTLLNSVPAVRGTFPDQTTSALRILRMLLDYGAKPTLNALSSAVDFKNTHMVQLLLENGGPMMDINKLFSFRDGRIITLLHVACGRTHYHVVDLVNLLLDHGADIDALDSNHLTALNSTSCSETVKVLLDRGADPNIPDSNGFTPLHKAIGSGRQATVTFLLDSGADCNIPTATGLTPLHTAAVSLTQDDLKFLVESGPFVNTIDHDDLGLLYHDDLRLLLESGATVNAIDHDGRTALHHIVTWGHGTRSSDHMALLLDHGADPLIKDADGKTALDLLLLSYDRSMWETWQLNVCSMLLKAVWKQKYATHESYGLFTQCGGLMLRARKHRHTYSNPDFRLSSLVAWPNGKALDYESRDSRFDPWRDHFVLLLPSLADAFDFVESWPVV
ncbi:Pfs, NACHT and ankyrin domain protein, partial [Aureobasidium melanogenum]